MYVCKYVYIGKGQPARYMYILYKVLKLLSFQISNIYIFPYLTVYEPIYAR